MFRRSAHQGPVGLALGGGAALGWAHIGVIRALQAANIEVDIISGTSIGAVAGACLAAGKIDDLEELARSVNLGEILRMSDIGFIRGGLLGGRGVEGELEEHFGDLRIEEFDKPFAAVASDLYTGDRVVFTTGKAVPAIRASISVPGIFPPVEADGRLLADGMLVDPVPVGAARELGADKVIAVDLTADYHGFAGELGLEPGKKLPMAAGLAIARASIGLMMSSLGQVRCQLDGADLRLTPKIGHIDVADFTRADELIDLGRAAVDENIDAIRAIVAPRQLAG